jgi:putative OPT family oligopeptide transporter
MAVIEKSTKGKGSDAGAAYKPYISPSDELPELTWSAVLLGALLGIVFGASSLYLVLKVGLTVSASIPVAVLSITIFRLFSRVTGLRKATILENNIVQTTGSAGESIAFGVGVTMPALLLLGFDLDVVRVMTVGSLGGLLGILMMIPLRRALIVRQHGKLTYPEGTACADVLISGEEGGATAKTVFAGFGLAFLYKFLMGKLKLWQEVPAWPLHSASGEGLRKAEFGGEVTPELLGVGYIIGPKIGATMLAGGILAYLVLLPLIALFGENLSSPLPPAEKLIREMTVGQIRSNYILYIGAGAVATGGIISMVQALPLIISSIAAGVRDLRAAKSADGAARALLRTDRDLPLWLVAVGCIGLIVALMAVPQLGLGFSMYGAIGALLIVFFGFLFVTVSARLTGEIGSSSNPISGMTVATLLLTCLLFLAMGRTDKAATLTALTIAGVVCIASSNGGTTAQDLKTGFLVGGTPSRQQIGILVGALSSALVIGLVLMVLDAAGTIYTKLPQHLPNYRVPDVSKLTKLEKPGSEYAGKDNKEYHVLMAGTGEIPGVPQGKYLVDDQGAIRYKVDPAIGGTLQTRDDGTEVKGKFEAPKTRLMAIVIDGVLNRKLPWGLVLIGALIAVVLELVGVSSLPFAVGVYLPLETSVPIFLGGVVRWVIDKASRRAPSEGEMSPGILLSSGYIAGGSIAGVLIACFEFLPDTWNKFIDVGARIDASSGLTEALGGPWTTLNWPPLIPFGLLIIILAGVGLSGRPKKPPKPVVEAPPKQNPPVKR